jgi:hypothetical protein
VTAPQAPDPELWAVRYPPDPHLESPHAQTAENRPVLIRIDDLAWLLHAAVPGQGTSGLARIATIAAAVGLSDRFAAPGATNTAPDPVQPLGARCGAERPHVWTDWHPISPDGRARFRRCENHDCSQSEYRSE